MQRFFPGSRRNDERSNWINGREKGRRGDGGKNGGEREGTFANCRVERRGQRPMNKDEFAEEEANGESKRKA